MCVQYHGGCSVPWGAQYRGGYLEYRRGVQYRGDIMTTVGVILSTVGVSVPWRDIMMHVGDIMSTVGDTIF